MRKHLHLLWLTGWLIPLGVGLLFFGRWIVEIVIPTLKGSSFNQLYDLHGVRYLDLTLGCVVVGFAWCAVVVVGFARKVSAGA